MVFQVIIKLFADESNSIKHYDFSVINYPYTPFGVMLIFYWYNFKFIDIFGTTQTIEDLILELTLLAYVIALVK